MTYEEIVEKARGQIGEYCKACYECNGKACKNQIPGPGAKGIGDTAIRNYDKWKEIRVNIDTLTENIPISTSIKIFDKTFKLPIFVGPIGAVNIHYGNKYSDTEYNDIIVSAAAKAGIAAFTGDGIDPNVMESATTVIKKNNGFGVPTVKPWNNEMLKEKFKMIKDCGSFAIAMDIDAAGLPFLKNITPKAGTKSIEELRNIIKYFEIPFVVKGIMTVKGALKAQECGAAAIVVSNHGGRVLDQCTATAEVLEDIVKAVKCVSANKESQMKIFVDGGIRSGADVFKALAIGADGVLICRPFVLAVYGDGSEGVLTYIKKIAGELEETMAMCGAHCIDEITRDMVTIF